MNEDLADSSSSSTGMEAKVDYCIKMHLMFPKVCGRRNLGLPWTAGSSTTEYSSRHIEHEIDARGLVTQEILKGAHPYRRLTVDINDTLLQVLYCFFTVTVPAFLYVALSNLASRIC